jgi:hypothetical protein
MHLYGGLLSLAFRLHCLGCQRDRELAPCCRGRVDAVFIELNQGIPPDLLYFSGVMLSCNVIYSATASISNDLKNIPRSNSR